MDFDDIFKKLQEVFSGIRKIAWAFVPGAGLFLFIRWLLVEWLPARAKQWIAWLLEKIPAVDVDPATVNIAWDRVNQWVPLNEALFYGALYVSLAGMVAMMRFVRKLLPGS